MKRAFKKLAIALVTVMFGFQTFAQGRIDLNPTMRGTQEATNVTASGFSATFSFNSIESQNVTTEKGMFSTLTMDNTYQAGNIGDPSLPTVNKLIAVPFGVKDVTVTVKNYTTTVYDLSEYGISTVAPMQIPVRKDQKPEDIPFSYNEQAYNLRGFAERPRYNFAIEGTMRGVQVGALTINPVEYDAASNSIRVYNDIEVEVSFADYDETVAYGEFARTFSPMFKTVYSQFFNGRAINDVYDEHPDLWQSPVKMLVVANRMFEEAMQPWIEWKTTKGFYMDVHYTDESAVGTTANSIKSFIQGKYAQDAPTFIMIVGDMNQVAPALTSGQTATSCVSDLNYMSVDGDEFADMYHSRFPAETVAQFQAMINKSMEYEQLTMPDPSYLGNVLLIAGEDSGWGHTVGRPTIWYAQNYYYNTDHGFANVYAYTDQTGYTGCYNNLNTGVGFVNYTAHGSNTSWAGPSLTNSDVNNLTNEHKYFLAMGNCCEAADWGYSGACFGETMVRAENKAAYAYIGSCPSTYWLNDYYFGVGATSRADGTMPSYEETTMGCYDAIWTDNAYNTVCAIPFIGNLAGNAAGALGYTLHVSTLYCWQAYHVLGDGSVLPYRIQPVANDISHLPTLPIGLDYFEVSAEPGSYVGISKDGVLYGAGTIDESGTTNISLTPITSGGDVTICITHPDCIPSIETIPAAALTGPYIAVDSYEMDVEQANYGETVGMDITVKNVGADATNNITATLTTENEYVTILSAGGSVASLAPDQTATMEGFQFEVAENVPDKTKAQFILVITDGTTEWEGKFNIELHAPVLTMDNILQSDESVNFTFKNTGTAPFYGGVLAITSCSPDLVFDPETMTIEEVVEGGESITLTSNYTVNETVELGTTFEVAYSFATGLFELQNIFTLDYGKIMEDFESGVFDEDWTLSSQHPWTITNGGPRGTKCAKSSNAGVNSSEGYCQLTVDVLAAGELTFMYKVSSETNYDKLHFYMDGQEKGVWSGEVAWAQFVQPVTVGQHTFKWSYTKDYSMNSGEDAAYIDDIIFPPTNVITFIAPATNLEVNVDGHNVSLTWDASEEAVSYLVKRNNETIGTTTETSLEDVVEESGTYMYSVYAVNSTGSMSTPVSEIVVLDFTGVVESEANFYVYPNPAENVLNVVSNGQFEYQLINSLGQVVISGNSNGNAQLNVNGINGMYILKVIANGSTTVRKVVVK